MATPLLLYDVFGENTSFCYCITNADKIYITKNRWLAICFYL